MRSTFGTSSELLNILRLIYSRLGEHMCPNGHLHPPTIDVALEIPLVCPICGAVFPGPGAESFAFNSEGACPRYEGIGVVREVDDAALIPDPSKTIEEGAVASWQVFGLNLMPQIVAEFGVRTDVPYQDLSPHEKDIVLDGPAQKRLIQVPSKRGTMYELNFTYRNARQAVLEALKKANDERALKRLNKFLTMGGAPSATARV